MHGKLFRTCVNLSYNSVIMPHNFCVQELACVCVRFSSIACLILSWHMVSFSKSSSLVFFFLLTCMVNTSFVEYWFYGSFNIIFHQKKKSTKDELFEKPNTQHDNITLTIEENPTELLVTEIVRHNSAIITKVYSRSKKFPVHWSSKIPLRYKRNTIKGELHEPIPLCQISATK